MLKEGTLVNSLIPLQFMESMDSGTVPEFGCLSKWLSSCVGN